MSIKTIFSALILVASPTLSLAEGCRGGGNEDQQAMSCVPGTMWDADVAACIPATTS